MRRVGDRGAHDKRDLTLEFIMSIPFVIDNQQHRMAEALKKRMQGDLEAEAFTEATLKLIEELIAFLRDDKVEVRLYDHGFLHAKAYLFHQDKVGPHNRADRLRPFAAIVGSSNFTGPGLVSNKELNLVHRVILPTESAVDHEAAERASYLQHVRERETLLDPSGVDVPE